LQKVQEGVCHYCGGKFTPEEITMDHIVPVSRGGKSVKGNIVAACKPCNSKKKYYTPAEIILREDMGKDVSF
jgi:5-methylcytosine-specific restriction endonuclease McrA